MGGVVGLGGGELMIGVLSGGFKRGERRGGSGSVASPGVLFLVTRLWSRRVCCIVFGAVGLLDKVGSTLGGRMSSSPTLGSIWLLML